jgi:hypothetical protein
MSRINTTFLLLGNATILLVGMVLRPDIVALLFMSAPGVPGFSMAVISSHLK